MTSGSVLKIKIFKIYGRFIVSNLICGASGLILSQSSVNFLVRNFVRVSFGPIEDHFDLILFDRRLFWLIKVRRVHGIFSFSSFGSCKLFEVWVLHELELRKILDVKRHVRVFIAGIGLNESRVCVGEAKFSIFEQLHEISHIPAIWRLRLKSLVVTCWANWWVTGCCSFGLSFRNHRHGELHADLLNFCDGLRLTGELVVGVRGLRLAIRAWDFLHQHVTNLSNLK